MTVDVFGVAADFACVEAVEQIDDALVERYVEIEDLKRVLFGDSATRALRATASAAPASRER